MLTETARKSRVHFQHPQIFTTLRQNASAAARALAQHISPGLLGLWLLEMLLCGALMYALLAAPVTQGLQLQAVNQAILLALTIGLVAFTLGFYSADFYGETRRLLLSTVMTTFLAIPAALVVAWLIGVDMQRMLVGHPLLSLALLIGWMLFALVVRLGVRHALKCNLFLRRVLVIAGDREADSAANRLVAALQSTKRGFFDVTAVLSVREAARLTPELLSARRIWGVVMTSGAQTNVEAELVQARLGGRSGRRLWSETEFWEAHLRRVDIDHPAAVRPNTPFSHSRLSAVLNRGADIVLALILLTVTLPLMLVTALLVKLDSPGDILYRQERVGLDGRHFVLIKFHSMRSDAEAAGPVWASQRDSRVTRVGAFIRLTRIDELPQLFNVLRGEMSFIGPRPERPHFVEKLATEVPFFCERNRVKPGLTGWAQVNYPYGASVEDARNKLSYDLYYVKHRNMLLDILILFSTVRVVLFQKGAR